MSFHYLVTTDQGGVTQELKIDGPRGLYFAYDRSLGKGYEGEFKILAATAREIETLASEVGDYTCQSSVAADDQVIKISWNQTQIVCSEAKLNENIKLRALVQYVRQLIGRQIRTE